MSVSSIMKGMGVTEQDLRKYIARCEAPDMLGSTMKPGYIAARLCLRLVEALDMSQTRVAEKEIMSKEAAWDEGWNESRRFYTSEPAVKSVKKQDVGNDMVRVTETYTRHKRPANPYSRKGRLPS